MTTSPEIAALHAEYCRLTGFNIPLDMAREAAWFEFHFRRQLGIEDLRALIAEHKRRMGRGEVTAHGLTFRNLIGNADAAEENAVLLRARRRVPVPTPQEKARAEVLRQARPQAADPRPVECGVSVADVLKRMREAVDQPTGEDGPEPCGDCDPCCGGRPDQCAICPTAAKEN